MKLYKKLGDYLGAPVGREGIIPQSFLEELLRDIKDEPPLPFHERLIYDLTCNRDVFHELGFSIRALMKYAKKTQLLPVKYWGLIHFQSS